MGNTFRETLLRGPKELRARTYPELYNLYKLKQHLELKKNITRTKEEIRELMKDDVLNEILDNNRSKIFGTASGSGYFSYQDIKTHIRTLLLKSDIEYILFYITVWYPERKLWISLKDCEDLM